MTLSSAAGPGAPLPGRHRPKLRLAILVLGCVILVVLTVRDRAGTTARRASLQTGFGTAVVQEAESGAAPGTAGKPPHAAYLVVAPFWGLTNQRVSLLRGLVTARRLGAALVAPHWYLDYMAPLEELDIRPIDYLFDFEALRDAAAAELGVPLDPQRVTEAGLRAWLQRHGVACLSAPASLIGLQAAGLAPDAEALPLSRLLRPAPRFAGAAAAARAALGTSYAALAARVEPDFERECVRGFKREQALFKRRCYVGDAAIAAALGGELGLRNGTALYVASGSDRAALPAICARFRCLQRRDVLDPLSQLAIQARAEANPTSRAFVDFLIAEGASDFFGNIYSSYARLLHMQFEKSNRTAAFYNGPCTAGGNCS
eukprot:scaffold9.g3131.t1